MYTIGVDIGATNTKLVVLENFKILKKKQITTPQKREELINFLENNINNLIFSLAKNKIKGIGLGIPGPLNKKRDFILNPPNLKCLVDFPLAKIIEKDLKIKTIMENDVNCFTLAEAAIGAAQEAESVAGITLGTGLGGGLVQKLKIEKGAFGSASEFGQMIINLNNKSSTLEDYCSERFFKRKNFYSKKLDDRAKKGDKKAKKVFEEYGKYLGIGLVNVINILDPEVIVIGGGISKAHKFFLAAAKKEIAKRVLSPLSKKFVKIKVAKLKDFSGAVGAALIIYYEK